jgi:hypothetical protein
MIEFSPAVAAAIARRGRREGLQIHVASYGGSGTVFFTNWLDRLRRVKTPLWHALINHYAMPIDFEVPRLVLMADPLLAYSSVWRRGLQENVTRHMHGGQYGQDHATGMECFFDLWTKASPIIFCKYEAVFDRFNEICRLLEIPRRGFPHKKARRSEVVKEADGNYRLHVLRERFLELPDFIVREAPCCPVIS